MKSQNVRYTREFKLAVCKLAQEQGGKYASLGKDLGVSAQSIESWIGLFLDSGELKPQQMVGH